MEEQKQHIFIASGAGSGLAQRSKPTLRVCQECDYKTFAHYVTCPRCNSEKWRNELT